MGHMRKWKKDPAFRDSLDLNMTTYTMFYNRLMDLAVSRFEYTDLPETVSERYMERLLFYRGRAVIFRDPVIGDVCLALAELSQFDVYGNPLRYVAHGYNGYTSGDLDQTNSALIYNNRTRTPTDYIVRLFARRLYDIERAIDVNIRAQKTPVLIRCSEDQRLTMLNMYEKYDGNQPFIFGSDDLNDFKFEVLSTEAPFVAPSLFDLKAKIWNEALVSLGYAPTNLEKKERVNTLETDQAVSGVIASRYSALESRREAWEQYNKIYDLNVQVDFRDPQSVYLQAPGYTGDGNEGTEVEE